MRIFLIILGTIFTLAGALQGFKYLGDFFILTSYGKGYVTGSLILFLLGLFLIYLGFRKKKTS